MKNIHEILKELGIEIPDDKKAGFDTAVNENYKTVAETDKLRTARDTYKTQLDEVSGKLKAFEGVDVNALKGEITKLQNDLTAKDTEYQQKLADMEFDTDLETAISASGAKNAKAVRALLDIDVLKASKNRKDDIKAALDKTKTDNDYLFKSDEPIMNPTAPTNTGGGTSDPLAAMRAAMGLPTKNN